MRFTFPTLLFILMTTVFSHVSLAAGFAAPVITSKSPVNANINLNLRPVISTYSPTGCIKKNSTLTIIGNNFGAQKGVSLGGHGINVKLRIKSWKPTKIIVQIPSDKRIKNGEWYYTGIKDLQSNNWLSNINRNITICSIKRLPTNPALNNNISIPSPVVSTARPKQKTTTSSGVIINTVTKQTDNDTQKPSMVVTESQQTSAASTSQDDPLNSSYYENEESNDWNEFEYYGSELTTSTVLPNSFGSLIDRQLPEPPPAFVEVQKKYSSAQKNSEPGELIIISNDMNEARQLSQQLADYDVSTKRRTVLNNLGLVITTFRIAADADLARIIQDVRQAYPAMWVDMNHRYRLQGSRRDTEAAKRLINWTTSAKNCDSNSLKIGLIDTEINRSHPALKKSKIITYSVLSNGIKKAGPEHATAIAGLLVGNPGVKSFSGLLPSSTLYSTSVFRQRDKKNVDTTAEWIIKAIDWLLSKKVQTINMSIGGPRNLLLDVAIRRTIKSGVIVVAAAGNGGNKASPVYPAAQPGVIAVTAVDRDLKLYRKANVGNYIDFAAPGVDVWSANAKGSGKFFSGTSYAVPFVTASLTLLNKEVGPRMAYQQLQVTARDLGNKGRDSEFGWGLIQNLNDCQ